MVKERRKSASALVDAVVESNWEPGSAMNSATTNTSGLRPRQGVNFGRTTRSRVEETASGNAPCARFFSWMLPVFAFSLPLAVLPGLEQPFSRPKLVLWSVVVLVGLLSCARHVHAAWRSLPSWVQAVLTVWLGTLGAAALLDNFSSPVSLILPLAGVGWLVLLLAVRLQPERLAWGLVLSGGAVAAVALAQFLHLDPFSRLGWLPASTFSSRMSVFSTLGNPNFVAAFLSGLLPLSLSLMSQMRKYRWQWSLLFALQVTAILATGSRAPILALAGASVWMVSLHRRKLAGAFLLIALCIILLVTLFSSARDLGTTLKGRAYIWKVAAPHLADHFVFGLGPGGFGASFPVWEAQYWKRAGDVHDRIFAGLEDHAHNDYLEIFADYGIAGLSAFLAVLSVFLRLAWIRTRNCPARLVAGAAAGVVALAAVALVDFPLMRPAEVFLFWSLMAITVIGNSQPFQGRQAGIGNSRTD